MHSNTHYKETYSMLIERFGNIFEPLVGYPRHYVRGTSFKKFDEFLTTFENAFSVGDYLDGMGINTFSQKCGWVGTEFFDDVAIRHKEGGVFFSSKKVMPWQVRIQLGLR